MVDIPYEYMEAALVSCCGAMYMFGGYKPGAEKTMSNSLLVFKPRQQGGIVFMHCRTATTGI